jgi:hypothetical protein
MSFRHCEERSLRRHSLALPARASVHRTAFCAVQVSNLAFNLRLLRQPFELPRNDITKADTVPPALLMYFQDG